MYSSVDTIKKMIEDGNIEDAKLRILNGIQINSSMKYFTDLMDLLDESNSNIFSEDNGFEFILDKNEWTNSYFAEVRSKLKFNFSKEKLKHYNDISIYLSSKEISTNYEDKYTKKDTSRVVIRENQTKEKKKDIFKYICITITFIFTITLLIKLLNSIVVFLKNQSNKNL